MKQLHSLWFHSGPVFADYSLVLLHYFIQPHSTYIYGTCSRPSVFEAFAENLSVLLSFIIFSHKLSRTLALLFSVSLLSGWPLQCKYICYLHNASRILWFTLF